MELMTLPWLLLGLFIFFAFTTEAMTGFGSIVIALSLGVLVLPMEVILPVLVPLNILMSGTLSWRHRRWIHGPTLWRLIMPLMVIGTLVGYGLAPWLGEHLLQSVFGVLVLWFAGRESWRFWQGLRVPTHGAAWARSWTLLAGLTHGLFASGGPLLVYALSGLSLDKQRFRATLIVVWFALNSLLTLVLLLDGRLLPVMPNIAMLAPVVLLAMVLGDWLHHRVDERRFKQLVMALLMVTGAILAWPF